MSAQDVFAEKFRNLLREIPNDCTLPQWQFIYRQAIFNMGMQILERFSYDAYGPNPLETDSAGGRPVPGNPPPYPGGPAGGGGVNPLSGTGGHGIGGQPSFIIAGVALALQPVIIGKRP